MVRLRTSGALGRRLVQLGDSEAACATLGVNQTQTKFQVWVLSAAIAGFSGARVAAVLGSASTQDFQMLAGLPYLLLVVVGGVAVVSGALLGGLLLQSFTWYTELFPSVIVSVFGWFSFNLFNLLMSLGPGLAGIGVDASPAASSPRPGRAPGAPKGQSQPAAEAAAATSVGGPTGRQGPRPRGRGRAGVRRGPPRARAPAAPLAAGVERTLRSAVAL